MTSIKLKLGGLIDLRLEDRHVVLTVEGADGTRVEVRLGQYTETAYLAGALQAYHQAPEEP